MKSHVILILFAVTSLLSATAAGTGTVYVSSSAGSDSADGKSVHSPVKTIARARELGSDLRLREGDVFYEYIRGGGFSISSYRDSGSGRGVKPVISGFRIVPASDSLWERGFFDASGWHEDSRGNIYRLDLMKAGFGGYTGNVSENDHKNIHNVGAIYDPAADRVYGRKCQCTDAGTFTALEVQKTGSPYKYLCEDMDFYQPRGQYRYLYVLAGDPSLLEGRELWLSMGADGIRGTDYSVKGIKFTGWGKTAVRGGSHIVVKNCDFDIIGGSVHEYEPDWIRFGNGVEFWADKAVECEVSRCRFSRIFDTATTIQGPMSRRKGSECHDISFHHNEMRGCRQDFEVWINSADGLMPSDCSFRHNRGYDCGDNGFDTREYNNTHLLHYILSPYRVEGIDISSNRFEDGQGLYYANSALDNVSIGRNVYICRPGAPVIHGLFGSVEIDAPVKQGSEWVFAEGLSPDGTVTFSRTHSGRDALRRFNAFINSVTGGCGFEVILK